MAKANRYTCGHCDFGADTLDEMAAHDVVAHGLVEASPDKLPPLPAPSAQDPRVMFERGLKQLLCSRRGHVPNPRSPRVCVTCGASLEVPRG